MHVIPQMWMLSSRHDSAMEWQAIHSHCHLGRKLHHHWGKPTIRLHRLVLSRLAWGSQMSCNTSQVSLTLYVVAKCLGDGVTQNFTYNVADKVHICTCVCTNSLSMKVPLSLVALDVS